MSKTAVFGIAQSSISTIGFSRGTVGFSFVRILEGIIELANNFAVLLRDGMKIGTITIDANTIVIANSTHY
jgi:hypothetical protein